MSRLDELYKAMQTLNSVGLVLNDDLLSKINELEEDIIKNEILPIIQDTIKPALSPVKRDLILVVEYSPNEPISVKLSRKRNFVKDISDVKIIKSDPEVEHKTTIKTKKYSSKAPATNLRIIFPNGKIIQNRTTVETMVEFIKYVGVAKVRTLGLTRCRIPLVSNTLDKKYRNQQQPLGNGWYVITNTCTEAKRKDINKISDAYNLGVKVEILY